ncbi:MAG: TetR/AcrR family transcriptional regulator [Clostridium sp.]|nr:TetR/AcrR family transcriptional regulator [Clostridium sp.]
MTHEEISQNTKHALAASLKTFMARKSLSKITISELCADCGVNRKTFYYHFEDIYALLRWMLEQETLDIVKKYNIPADHEKVLSFVIDYVDANSHILNCVYEAIGREGMKRFFFSDLEQSIGVIIENLEKEMNKKLDTRYRNFLCNFYANALSGLLLDWFLDRSVCTREELIKNVSFTVKAALRSAISLAD